MKPGLTPAGKELLESLKVMAKTLNITFPFLDDKKLNDNSVNDLKSMLLEALQNDQREKNRNLSSTEGEAEEEPRPAYEPSYSNPYDKIDERQHQQVEHET